MCMMVLGKTLAKAAIQPAEPEARPPIRKSDWPPKMANSVGVKVEDKRMIFPTEAHVNFVPTVSEVWVLAGARWIGGVPLDMCGCNRTDVLMFSRKINHDF